MTPEQQQYENNLARLHAGITDYMVRNGITNPVTGFEQALSHAGDASVQARNEQELLRWCSQLTPEHLQNAQRLVNEYGPEALWGEMIQTGLSRGAVEVAAASFRDYGGFPGLVEAVEGRLVEQANRQRQADIEAVAQNMEPTAGDSPTVAAFKGSPLATFAKDPHMQQLAGALLAENGTAVPPGATAVGVLAGYLTGGKDETGLAEDSAAGFNASRIGRGQVVRDARGNVVFDPNKAFLEKKWTPEQATAAFAKEYGGSAKSMQEMMDAWAEAELHSELATRLATSSAKRRSESVGQVVEDQWKADPERSAQNDRRIRTDKSRRRSLEQAFDHLDAETPERPANARPSPVTEAAEREPAPVLRREALESAYDEIDSRDEETTGSDSSGLRGVLSQRYDELEEEAA